MSLLPIFVKMTGRSALVVGGGAAAAAKVEALLVTGARVTVVAPKVEESIASRHERGEIDWASREFLADDVAGRAIVFGMTCRREVDRAVFRASMDAGVWCNAIDDPDHCDFYTPAVVRRGDLQIAISTNGQSPALAQQIRKELEAKFDPSWGEKLAGLGRRRKEVLANVPGGEERTALLHAQARAALDGARDGVLHRAATAVWNWLNREDDKVALI